MINTILMFREIEITSINLKFFEKSVPMISAFDLQIIYTIFGNNGKSSVIRYLIYRYISIISIFPWMPEG